MALIWVLDILLLFLVCLVYVSVCLDGFDLGGFDSFVGFVMSAWVSFEV